MSQQSTTIDIKIFGIELLTMPRLLVNDIQTTYYNSQMANGHADIAKIMSKIPSKYHWPTMMVGIIQYVKNCHKIYIILACKVFAKLYYHMSIH